MTRNYVAAVRSKTRSYPERGVMVEQCPYREEYVTVCWRCGYRIFWDTRTEKWTSAASGKNCPSGSHGHQSRAPQPVSVKAVNSDGEVVL